MKNASTSVLLATFVVVISAQAGFSQKTAKKDRCDSTVALNGDQISVIVGKRADDESVKSVFAKLREGKPEISPTRSDIGTDWKEYRFPEIGLIINTTNVSSVSKEGNLVVKARVWDVMYVSGSRSSSCGFPGPLPLNLRWGMSRSGVRAKLGNPEDKELVGDSSETDIFIVSGFEYKMFFWISKGTDGKSNDGELSNIHIQKAKS